MLAASLTSISGIAQAQEISCENLQQVIKLAGQDPTLKAVTGSIVKAAKGDESAQYTALIPIWKLGEVYGQAIYQGKYNHDYEYEAYSSSQGSGKEEMDAALKAIRACVGNSWVVKTEKDGLGDTLTYFKNPADFVVIDIVNHDGMVVLDCYNDSKHSAPECTTGSCDNYWGSIHFFTEDNYGGTFIDGTLSGIGRVNWYSTRKWYQGSFIDNQLAGFGTMYDENNKVIKTGFFFNGDTVTIDQYKSGCQFGDCQNGFGVKIISNNIYIGNFKGGVPEGLGETVIRSGETQAAYFGHYVNGHCDGKGIFVNHKGNYTFGNYADMVARGKYEVDMTDRTTIQANTTDNTSSFFDENNILTKAGTGVDAFVENTSPSYLNLKAAAKSVRQFYAYRPGGYKEIKGEQSKLLKNLGLQGGYKCSLLFQKLYDATIDADHNNYYFVTVYLSGKSPGKLQWINIYNKYYDILRKALGNRWKVITDGGKANAAKPSVSLVCQNIFDKTQSINLSYEQRGVQMEIH